MTKLTHKYDRLRLTRFCFIHGRINIADQKLTISSRAFSVLLEEPLLIPELLFLVLGGCCDPTGVGGRSGLVFI